MRHPGRTLLLLAWIFSPGAYAAITSQTYDTLAVYPAHEVPASAESLDDGKISAELNGRIARVGVQPGQGVNRGQELFRLDCRDLELTDKRLAASLKAAEARRRLARMQAERAITLVNDNFVSREYLNQRQAEFEASSAEYQSFAAERDRVRHDIGKCSIRAPYAGIVRERTANLGEFVAPGTPLVHLVGTGRVEVSARLTGTQIDALRRGRDYRFDAGGQQYDVKPRTAGGVFDPRERSAEIRFSFAGKGAEPGRAGVLRWRESTPHVPAELLVSRNGRLGVFIVQGGRASFYAIPGAQAGRPAAVHLPPDARIVVDGRQALRDGDPVR